MAQSGVIIQEFPSSEGKSSRIFASSLEKAPSTEKVMRGEAQKPASILDNSASIASNLDNSEQF